MILAAKELMRLGAKNVLIKGGHLKHKFVHDIIVNKFEIKIFNYDDKSQNFINYLNESESEFTTLDILSDIDLIPTASEIEDPISWAARTSLPPI